MSERDTHFAGFAKLLQHELNAAYHLKVMQMQSGVDVDGDAWDQEVQQMITRRAYDFAVHVYDHVGEGDKWAILRGFGTFEENIPDMTHWPESD